MPESLKKSNGFRRLIREALRRVESENSGKKINARRRETMVWKAIRHSGQTNRPALEIVQGIFHNYVPEVHRKT
ncbi:MAG: hypothetical protein V4437_01540 [Patescibacteria group bacterium]